MEEVSNSSIAFWLNWRAVLCFVSLLTTMSMASYAIRKYEGPKGPRSTEQEEVEDDVGAVFQHELWQTYWIAIRPAQLLVFRMVAFFIILCVLLVDARVFGWHVFYFYTEWTYVLLILYFGIGSCLSAYGCYHERGSDERPNQLVGVWGYVLQILYQILAGAIVLANIEYWFINAQYVFKTSNSMAHMIGVIMHLINFPFFFGDVILNSLRFPWFRIAYFVIWTCVYIFFQWLIHVYISIGWPSAFLTLSQPLAPLWYFLIILFHVPSYGVFYLIVKAKYFLSRD